jgi:hypothetical protein
VVRARAQPRLGVLRPLVIAAGDLDVLVPHAATVFPASRRSRRRPFRRSDEDDCGDRRTARSSALRESK